MLPVQESIRQGSKEWEGLVPNAVAEQIKKLGLWGYDPNATPVPSNGVAVGSNGQVYTAHNGAHATGAVTTSQ